MDYKTFGFNLKETWSDFFLWTRDNKYSVSLSPSLSPTPRPINTPLSLSLYAPWLGARVMAARRAFYADFSATFQSLETISESLGSPARQRAAVCSVGRGGIVPFRPVDAIETTKCQKGETVSWGDLDWGHTQTLLFLGGILNVKCAHDKFFILFYFFFPAKSKWGSLWRCRNNEKGKCFLFYLQGRIACAPLRHHFEH